MKSSVDLRGAGWRRRGAAVDVIPAGFRGVETFFIGTLGKSGV